MGKNFIILHGLGGNSHENWFDWMKIQLNALGHKVQVPDLPDSDTPSLNEWLDILRESTKNKKNVIIIGHSLGGSLAVKFLEENPKNIDAVYFVATPTNDLGWFELKKFFEKPFKKEPQTKAKVHIIYSTDDPYVSSFHCEKLREMFPKAYVHEFKNLYHFNISRQAPELLKIILSSL